MSISIEFHRRPSSRGSTFAGSLFVRVISCRLMREITLPWRLYADEWDGVSRSVRLDHAHPGREGYLRKVSCELVKVCSFLWEESDKLRQEGRLSAARLVDRYKTHMAGCGLKKWSEELMTKLESDGQTRTARAYSTASRRLLCFAGSEDLELSRLTADLLGRFEKALRQEGLADNTISFHLRMLRAIFNKAVDSGRIAKPARCPFAGVFTGVAQTPKRALSAGDMRSITAIDWKSGELPLSQRMACALFLFSFWARGMSFVDLAFLRKSDIRDGRLTYRRRKSGSRLDIPLTEEMRELLDWFAPMVEDSPFLLPLIRRTGQDEYRQYESALRLQNRRLQRLAARLSTHVARHSWATIAKRQLVPLAQISEALGHRSEKTTSIYLASFEPAIWHDINTKIRASIKKVG